MTDGFGPEEYLIRRAPAGPFQVRANSFRADPLNPNGPTAITVRLWRNWGRANETSESFVIELTGTSSTGMVDVGRFVQGQ